MSLGITANKKKNGALLTYIAKNIPDINLRKLLKIIYLIDIRFMKLRGFPFTWFNYYAWAKGPVAPEVYDVKNGAFSEYVLCHKNLEKKNIITPVILSDASVSRLMNIYSSYELDVINGVIDKYKNHTADELTALTHENDSLWSQTVKENNIQFTDGKSDVQILLQKLNIGDVEKEETYEDALEYMQCCSRPSVC